MGRRYTSPTTRQRVFCGCLNTFTFTSRLLTMRAQAPFVSSFPTASSGGLYAPPSGAPLPGCPSPAKTSRVSTRIGERAGRRGTLSQHCAFVNCHVGFKRARTSTCRVDFVQPSTCQLSAGFKFRHECFMRLPPQLLNAYRYHLALHIRLDID